MTQVQREKIIRMKSTGKGYQEIAAQLGMSYNTVKSFCRRANLNVQNEKPVPSEYTHCRLCGNPLIHKDKCKKKKFCSDSCRLAWWNSHKDEVQKKAFHTMVCKHCSQEFESYSNQSRRYCSHNCYILSRFSKEDVHDKGTA